MAWGVQSSEQRDIEDIHEGGGNHYDSRHSHKQYFSNGFVKITVLLVTVALVCLVLSQSTYPTQFLQRSYSIASPGDGTMQGNVSSLSNDTKSKMAWGVQSSEQRDIEDIHEGGGNHYDSRHSHKQYFSNGFVKITVLLVTVALVCLVLSQSTYPTQFLQRSYSIASPGDGTMQGNVSSLSNDTKANDENTLESTLKKASMGDNRTVIITALNSAWAEPNSIFDLFLESFRIGNQTEHLLDHLVVVTFDNKAYSRCLEVHKHCYPLTTDGVDFSGEAHFMSEDYLKMMWRRIDFLRVVLELGYDFVFTDADVMWLRDPFPRFYPDGDFQIACDHYWYNYTDLENSPNGGFNYVKSNNRTIQFYKFWYAGRDYFPGKHDQDVLNMVKFNPIIQDIGLEMRFFDTAYFGGFCEPSKDLDLVITMHANCCIGMENKIHDIKMAIDDWTRYMALPSGERNLSSRSWTVPRICG